MFKMPRMLAMARASSEPPTVPHRRLHVHVTGGRHRGDHGAGGYLTKNRTRYAGSEPVRWSVLGLSMVDARDSDSPRRNDALCAPIGDSGHALDPPPGAASSLYSNMPVRTVGSHHP